MIIAVHTKEDMLKEKEIFAQLLQHCEKLQSAGVASSLIEELLYIRRDLQELSIASLKRAKESYGQKLLIG